MAMEMWGKMIRLLYPEAEPCSFARVLRANHQKLNLLVHAFVLIADELLITQEIPDSF